MRLELFVAVGTQSLEHPKAWLARAQTIAIDQALVQKRPQGVQDVNVVRAAHCLGGLDGPAPGKDSQLAKQECLISR